VLGGGDGLSTYSVQEVFYSLQGEGVRAGTPNVFVRFAGCNMTCRQETHGFDCDTDFSSGLPYTAAGLVEAAYSLVPTAIGCGVIFTGGEPALQLDRPLVEALRAAGFATLAIETNGSRNVDDLGLDWITVSPKTAEHALRQLRADEAKYVRHVGQPLPKSSVSATYYLISPAAEPDGTILRDTLRWCIALCKEHPPWRLSCQQHKLWGVR
jgi:7-carboxy-7-deazaguanine synthase